MSVKMGSNKWSIDSLTILEPSSVGAVTSTAASTQFIALDQLASYWAAGDSAQELDLGVVFEVSAFGGTAVTCTATVEVAPDSGAFTSPVTVGTIAITGTGRAVIVIDRDAIVNAWGTATVTVGSLRAKMTLSAGTSPTITYVAYVAPLVGL